MTNLLRSLKTTLSKSTRGSIQAHNFVRHFLAVEQTRGSDWMNDRFFSVIFADDATEGNVERTFSRVGELAAALPYVRYQQGGRDMSNPKRKVKMVAELRGMLASLIQLMGSRPAAAGDRPLAENEPLFSSLLGAAVESCAEYLDPQSPSWHILKGRRSLRNLGLIFRPEQESDALTATSCTLGGVPVFHIGAILDMIKSPEDVLKFASGFLARKPGENAIAMVDAASKALEATEFGNEQKADLLERLLSLSVGFGKVDEILDP